jgi:hypothetical protein
MTESTTLRDRLRELRDKTPHDGESHRWNDGKFCWRCKLDRELALPDTPEPPAEPWLYAIQETNAAGVTSWHDGENSVFGDRESAQDAVDCLNDEFPEGENPFQLVPLYRQPPADTPQGLSMEQVRDLVRRLFCPLCRDGDEPKKQKHGRYRHDNVEGSGLIAFCDEYVEKSEIEKAAKILVNALLSRSAKDAGQRDTGKEVE